MITKWAVDFDEKSRKFKVAKLTGNDIWDVRKGMMSLNYVDNSLTGNLYATEDEVRTVVDNLNKCMVEEITADTPDDGLIVVFCKDCHKYFSVTASEAAWYLDKGYNLPKRCPICRHQRREARKAAEES